MHKFYLCRFLLLQQSYRADFCYCSSLTCSKSHYCSSLICADSYHCSCLTCAKSHYCRCLTYAKVPLLNTLTYSKSHHSSSRICVKFHHFSCLACAKVPSSQQSYLCKSPTVAAVLPVQSPSCRCCKAACSSGRRKHAIRQDNSTLTQGHR